MRRRNLNKPALTVNHFLNVLYEYFFNDHNALLSLSAETETKLTAPRSQQLIKSFF
jgi:hypothetical protein